MSMHAFKHHPRGAMSALRVAKAFAACEGRCQGPCGRKLRQGDDYHVDHIIALENGGTDDDSNLQIICDWCHKPKTADDHSTAAKGKRVYVQTVVPSRFRRSRSWGRR
jgi:5-methylcytosine-specific restriction endonuclease McrA